MASLIYRALFSVWCECVFAACVVIVPFVGIRYGLWVKDPVEFALECSSTPCVVRSNHGGAILIFQAGGDALHGDSHEKLVIDGPCYSSCSIAAAMARPNACVTERAVLGFHMGWLPVFERLFPGTRLYTDVTAYYATDIQRWIKSKGGLPKEGLLKMSAQEASQFWPWCPKQDTRPYVASGDPKSLPVDKQVTPTAKSK